MVDDPLDQPSAGSTWTTAEPGDVSASDVPAVASPRDRPADDDPARRWVAVLLAAAAVLAATLAMRAAVFSDEAGGAWQSALRTELQRAAVLLQQVRQVYGTEGDEAFAIVTHEVLADQMRMRAQGEPAEVAEVLAAEARVHEDLVGQVKPATELTASGYGLPGGGYDLAARLVDYREAVPDVQALDPDALMEHGDRASGHALGVVSAGIPVAVAILIGSLAMPNRRRRRLLLSLGWLALAVGALVAIGLEATA